MADIPSDVLQVILDGINQQRGLALTKDVVTTTAPVPADNQGRNTMIRVSVPGSGINVDTYYRRLNLATLFQYVSKNIEDVGHTSVFDLLPTLADRRSVTLNQSDFVNVVIERDDDQTIVTLEAHPESLTFVGAIQLYLGDGEPEIPLDALLTEEGEPLFSEEDDFLLLE